MKPQSTLRNFIALVGSSIIAISSASAVTYTWTQTSVTGNQDWTTAGNWDVNGVYATGTANELRFFADTTTIHPTFGTQTIVSVPTTLSMGILTLQGKGPNNTTGFTTIIGDSNSTWTIGDSTTGTVNLNATRHTSIDRYFRYNIAANITLNQTLTTFTGNGSAGEDTRGGFEFSGNITGAAGYGITKSGTSVLILSGNNSYTGTTLVSGGVLRLGSASALSGGIGATGGTSALTINGGVVELASGNFQRDLGTGSSQFQITGGTSGFSAVGGHRVVTVNNDASQELQWGSTSFQPGTLVLNAIQANNSLELTNMIDLNNTTRTVQVNANKALLSGDIRTASGTAGLTKTGVGTLVLSGANSYNGPTTISGGALSVGATNNLGGAGANLVFNSGALQITGTSLTSMTGIGHTVSFTNNTAVGFDIHNAANTFTVDQVLNQGTGTLTKSGAGTLVLNQNNTFTGATIIASGTLVLDYTTNDGSKLAAAALNLNGGNLVLRGGSHADTVTSIVVAGNTGNAITREVSIPASTASISNSGVLTTSTNSNLTISDPGMVSTSTANVNGIQTLGRVTVGTHFATRDAGGLLQAYSGYTAATLAGGGNYTTVNQLTGGGDMTTADLQSYSLRIANSGNSDVLNLAATIDLRVENEGTFLYAGGFDNNYTINGPGTLGLFNTNRPINFNVAIGTLTVNAGLANGSGTGLSKAGAGTLVLGAANSYTSTTYIQQGVLRAANATALGNVSPGTIVQAGAALELSNGITVGAEALAITGTGISNEGALRNHSGSNKYDGLITIGASGARINSNVSTSLELRGGIVTTLTQDVTFGGAGNTTVSTTAISGSGRVIKDGNGILTLSAANTYTGATTVSVGTLYVTGALSNSAVTVQSAGTIGSNGVTGTLGNGLSIDAGGNLDLTGATLSLNSTGILSITGGNFTLGNLAFTDLVGWDWANAATGTYELIDGSFTTTWGSTAYLDAGSAYNFGNGNAGYFTSGSLNAVIFAIPEPSTALLGALGVLLLFRRRR